MIKNNADFVFAIEAFLDDSVKLNYAKGIGNSPWFHETVQHGNLGELLWPPHLTVSTAVKLGDP